MTNQDTSFPYIGSSPGSLLPKKSLEWTGDEAQLDNQVVE